MKHIWNCRRTGMAFLSLIPLSIALLTGKVDTSLAIAGLAGLLAMSNAYEGAAKKKLDKKHNQPKQRK